MGMCDDDIRNETLRFATRLTELSGFSLMHVLTHMKEIVDEQLNEETIKLVCSGENP